MFLLALLIVADTARTIPVPLTPAETVSVSITGRGIPVVAVPGLFGSAFGFRHVISPLVESGYQVVVVEPLGIGGSSRPREADYSLAAQGARVAAVLDSLGMEGAIFLAHSIGGAVVFRLAVQRPDLVTGIVSLEGGPAEEATTSGFRFAMRFARLIRIFGGEGLIRHQIRTNLQASSGDPDWVTEAVIEGYTADAARDLDATLDAFRGMADSQEPWTLAPRLGEIRCPVRLLLGTADHKGGVQPEEVVLLQDALSDFDVQPVDDAGHFILEERPDVVVDAVRRLRYEVAGLAGEDGIGW